MSGAKLNKPKDSHVTMRNIGKLLDKKLEPISNKVKRLFSDVEAIKSTMVTKVELSAAETSIKAELKSYIHEGVETIMNGMDSLSETFVEKARVDKLEKFVKMHD